MAVVIEGERDADGEEQQGEHERFYASAAGIGLSVRGGHALDSVQG